MYKKILLIMSLVLALSLGASGAWGAVVTCNDLTLLDEQSGAGHDFGWKDVSGNLATFNTFKATYDTNSHVLTMFTNWGPGDNTTGTGLTASKTADLFLNYDPVAKTAFAAVELFGPANATTSNTVYYNPTTITTSEDLFNGSGIPGYGRFYTTNEAPATGPPTYPIPVTASGGTTGTADVIWSAKAATEPFFTFAIDLDQIAGLNPNNFSFLWGTATCGNDVITCTVPVPPSLLLLGSGLLGLGVLRFRRKSV